MGIHESYLGRLPKLSFTCINSGKKWAYLYTQCRSISNKFPL